MTVDYLPEPCGFCGAPENHPGPCPHLPGTLEQLEELLAAVFLPGEQDSDEGREAA